METKSFKPEMESVQKIQQFVQDGLLAHWKDESQLLKIDLIIEEIIVNIINYGCKDIENGILDISINKKDDQIIMKISDNGVPFNPLEKPDPDINEDIDQRDPGGLGIFLVKQIAQKIEYERKKDRNNLRIFMNK